VWSLRGVGLSMRMACLVGLMLGVVLLGSQSGRSALVFVAGVLFL